MPPHIQFGNMNSDRIEISMFAVGLPTGCYIDAWHGQGGMGDRPAEDLLAENLKALIDERGWDYHKLAGQSGLSDSAVSNYLNKNRFPRAEQLRALAKALNVPISRLLLDCADSKSTGVNYRTLLKQVLMLVVESVKEKIDNAPDKDEDWRIFFARAKTQDGTEVIVISNVFTRQEISSGVALRQRPPP